MGQFSVRSPVHSTQWSLPELTRSLTTLTVSDIRGGCTIYIRYMSKAYIFKIPTLVLLNLQGAHKCSPEWCVPFSQWHPFVVQRNPVINRLKGGCRWVTLGVLNQSLKYSVLHLYCSTLSCFCYPRPQGCPGLSAHYGDPFLHWWVPTVSRFY